MLYLLQLLSVKITYNCFDLCNIIRLIEEHQHLVDRLKIGPAIFCAALALLSKIRDQVLFVRHVWHDLFSPATFYQQYNISPGMSSTRKTGSSAEMVFNNERDCRYSVLHRIDVGLDHFPCVLTTWDIRSQKRRILRTDVPCSQHRRDTRNALVKMAKMS